LITLNVRSFITGEDGQYRFPRVYSEMDYSIRARFGDQWSKSKTVTRFEMRDSVRVDVRIKNADVEAVHSPAAIAGQPRWIMCCRFIRASGQ
jgi:hypothetical protein